VGVATVSSSPTSPSGGHLKRPGEVELLLRKGALVRRRLVILVGHGVLLAVAAASAAAILFVFYSIARDAVPFFRVRGFAEFFTGTRWYPSAHPPAFGAVPLFVGSALVTLGASLVALPLGVAVAVCLSDVIPFAVRQWAKPMLEILAAIPSVAYGFFALVVLAPLLQERGGPMLALAAWLVGAPLAALGVYVAGSSLVMRLPARWRPWVRPLVFALLAVGAVLGLAYISGRLKMVIVSSGTNALNVSIILGIMALPTVASVSEDALRATGREIREASYALGATRAETMVRAVIPAAASGICAAVMLGIMRVLGETMVVWMASGNAAQIPSPWYNLLAPVRTVTATIAGDMGEADHMTGSERYHVLFALALLLLTIAFVLNLLSEWALRRARRGGH